MTKYLSALLLCMTGIASAQQQVINTGTPNSGTGDSAYVAFGKVNSNFTQLFNGAGGLPQIAAYSIVCNNTAVQATPAACGSLPASVTVTASQITSGSLLPTIPFGGSVTLNLSPSDCSADVSISSFNSQLAAATAAGNRLYLPDNTCYLINSPIVAPSGSSVIVSNPGRSTIKSDVNNTGASLLFAIKGIVNSTNVTGFVVEGVTLDGGLGLPGLPPGVAPLGYPGTGTDQTLSTFVGAINGTSLAINSVSQGAVYNGATIFDLTGQLSSLGFVSQITLSNVQSNASHATPCTAANAPCTATLSAVPLVGNVATETMNTTNHTAMVQMSSAFGYGSDIAVNIGGTPVPNFGCARFVLKNLTVQNFARGMGNLSGCNNMSIENVQFNNTGAGNNDYQMTSDLPFITTNSASLSFSPSTQVSSNTSSISVALTPATCGIYFAWEQATLYGPAAGPNQLPIIADITNQNAIINGTVILSTSGGGGCTLTNGNKTVAASGTLTLNLSQAVTATVPTTDVLKVYRQSSNNRVINSTFINFGSGTIDISGQYNFQCTGNRWIGSYATGLVTNSGGGNTTCYDQGSLLPGNSNLTITNNYVDGVTGNGFDLNCGDGLTVTGNIVINSGLSGISLTSNGTPTSENPLCTMQNVTVTGNTVKNSSYQRAPQFQTGTAIIGGSAAVTLKTVAGTGSTPGTYAVNLTTTSGSGSGAQASLTVAGGVITAWSVTAGGTGYAVNDTVSFTFSGGSGTAAIGSIGQLGTLASPVTSLAVSGVTGSCTTGSYLTASGFGGYPSNPPSANDAATMGTQPWSGSTINLALGFVGGLKNGSTVYCNNRQVEPPGAGTLGGDITFGVAPNSAYSAVQNITIGSNVLTDDQYSQSPNGTLTTTGAAQGVFVLPFSSTTGVVAAGQQIYCPGLQPASAVQSVLPNVSVTITLPTALTVASGATCYLYSPAPTTTYGIDSAPNLTLSNVTLAKNLNISGSVGGNISANAAAQLPPPGSPNPVPFNNLIPSIHLKNFSASSSPTVCAMGDSTVDLAPNYMAPIESLYKRLQRKMREDNPTKNITFLDFSIGGTYESQAFFTGTTLFTSLGLTQPAWFTNLSSTWESYLAAANCTTIFFNWGVNSPDIDTVASWGTLLTAVVGFSTPADIVLITNGVAWGNAGPSYASSFPTYIANQTMLRTMATSGSNMTIAGLPPLGVIDIGRYQDIQVYGTDWLTQYLTWVVNPNGGTPVNAGTLNPSNPNYALTPSPGGNFTLNFSLTNGSTFTGTTIEIVLGDALGGNSDNKQDYVSVTTDGSKCQARYFNTGNVLEATGTINSIWSSTVNTIQVDAQGDHIMVYCNPGTTGNNGSAPANLILDVIQPRMLNGFIPTIELLSAPSGGSVLTINSYAIGTPATYTSAIYQPQCYGASGGQGFNDGNGLNHNSSICLNQVYDAVISSMSFASTTSPTNNTLDQSGLPMVMPASGYVDTVGNFVIGANPIGGGTVTFTGTSGSVPVTISASGALSGGSTDIGRIITVQQGNSPNYTYDACTVTAATDSQHGTCTLAAALTGGAGPYANAASWITAPPYGTAQTTLVYPAPLNDVASGYFYFQTVSPIGAVYGAGEYWCVPVNAAQGTCYNNPYTSGTPKPPTSTTAFSGLTANNYTQLTATQITLVSGTVNAGSMGLQGCLDWDFAYTYNNSANTKGIKAQLSNSGPIVNATTETYGRMQNRMCNAGVVNSQSYAADYTTVANATKLTSQPSRSAVNTSTAQTAAISVNMANANDTATIENHSIKQSSN